MKKLFMTMLTVLACGAVHALPVGNPSDASLLCDGLFWEGNCCSDPCDPCYNWCEAWSFRTGFYGDYVFESHMEVDNGNKADIDHFDIYTNAAYLALNMFDRVDVFATLGASNFGLETNESAFATPAIGALNLNGRAELQSETRFSWSVGGRVTLWECGCTALGFEGQYFRTKPNVNLFAVNGFGSNPDNSVDATYSEWQVGFGISHRVHVLVPYIAVKYSRANVDFDNAVLTDPATLTPNAYQLSDLESKNHWGFAAGVSLVDCEKHAIAVEGRFANETAVHVNWQIRF